MPGVTAERGARYAGLALGLTAVVAGGLNAWSVAPSTAPVGSEVTIATAHNAAVGVTPADAILEAEALRPGRPGRGSMTISNHSGTPVLVTPQLAAEQQSGLESLVELELTHGGRTLYRGTAAALKGTAAKPVPLSATGTAKVHVRASISPSAAVKARHLAARWNIAFDVRAAQ